METKRKLEIKDKWIYLQFAKKAENKSKKRKTQQRGGAAAAALRNRTTGLLGARVAFLVFSGIFNSNSQFYLFLII